MILTSPRETPNPFTNAKVIGANVDAAAYHRQDESTPRGHPDFVMSRSELMLFGSCPSRWLAGYEPKDTDATDWGSLFDCLITEGREAFDKKYVVHPATVTATNTMACVKDGDSMAGDAVPWRACKESKEWKAANGRGRQVLSPDEYDEANQACRRLLGDPIFAEFIKCSAKQVMVTAEYRDAESGLVVPWKSLIDLVPDKDHESFGNYLADLKTARTAEPGAWEREIDKRNYDAQAAANTDAYVAATGERRESFAHIIVENTFPFEPSGAYVSAAFVELGRLKIVGALRFYCQCLMKEKFPTWRDFTRREVYGGFVCVEPEQWHSQLKQR